MNNILIAVKLRSIYKKNKKINKKKEILLPNMEY